MGTNAGVSVAVIGASGLVGREIIDVLATRKFPLSRLALFASKRSVGKELETPLGAQKIALFSLETVKNFDVVFLAAGGEFSKQYARQLADQNGVVIDNSSAFRLDKDVPLIIPEINPHTIKGKQLIANPNCTTAVLSVVLWPLYAAYGLDKLIVSTYQAVSGAGQAAMHELQQQTHDAASGKPLQAEAFARPILYNLIPRIDTMQDNGYTREEMKVTHELRKIFGNDKLAISCTAVRVPTMRAHAESVTFVAEKDLVVEEARRLLTKSPGVVVVDDPENFDLPMPLTASGKEDVAVGRLRHNLIFGNKSLDFFVCGDQLLKGAALNAVQIAELASGVART